MSSAFVALCAGWVLTALAIGFVLTYTRLELKQIQTIQVLFIALLAPVGMLALPRHQAPPCAKWSTQQQVTAYAKAFDLKPSEVTPKVLAKLKAVSPCEDLPS